LTSESLLLICILVANTSRPYCLSTWWTNELGKQQLYL